MTEPQTPRPVAVATMNQSDKRSIDQFINEHRSDIEQARQFDDEVNQRSLSADVDINAPMEHSTFAEYVCDLRG